jgi:hypothetical protein
MLPVAIRRSLVLNGRNEESNTILKTQPKLNATTYFAESWQAKDGCPSFFTLTPVFLGNDGWGIQVVHVNAGTMYASDGTDSTV